MGASESFRQQLRYAVHGAQTVHPQDIRGVRQQNLSIDETAERLWEEAFTAGRLQALEESLIWHFPMKEES